MKESILIIDDEPNFCQSVKILLEATGSFQVDAAYSGGEGLSLLQDGTYLGVILDIELPDMCGHDIAKNIVRHHPEIAVIILSGENDPEKGLVNLRRGVFDYLAKPCDPEHFVRILNNAIQQKQSERKLREAHEIIDRSPVIAFLWRNEQDWPVEFVSENVRSLCGYRAEDFVNGQILYADIIHPKDLDRVTKEVEQGSRSKNHKCFQHAPYRIITNEGQIRWVDDNTYLKRDDQGRLTHYQGVVLDVTDRVKNAKLLESSKEQMTKMHAELMRQKKILEVVSITDELTGLYNRRHLKTVLEQEFQRSKRHDTDLSCLLFDLDHFKKVNDKFGHDYGDTVLINISKILNRSIRSSDYAFRYGGEEFLLILPQTNIEGAIQTGEKIRLDIASNKNNNEMIASVTVSGGGASLIKHQPKNSTDLITIADKALYMAKENGRNQIVVCD